jgi:hypothetical protein
MLAPMIESLLIASVLFLVAGWALEGFAGSRNRRHPIGSRPANAHASSDAAGSTAFR